MTGFYDFISGFDALVPHVAVCIVHVERESENPGCTWAVTEAVAVCSRTSSLINTRVSLDLVCSFRPFVFVLGKPEQRISQNHKKVHINFSSSNGNHIQNILNDDCCPSKSSLTLYKSKVLQN